MKVRRATLKDIDPILDLLARYKDKDLLLPRTREQMVEIIRDFLVAVEKKQVVGAVALHPYTEKLAEIRSLAVLPDFQHRGIGRRLIDRCIREAKRLNLEGVFVLTYLDSWFKSLGFRIQPKESLPEKIWLDCQFCAKKDNCQEIALTYRLQSSVETK